MDYEISNEKRGLFGKLLDLLKEFNRVCEENDIKYFVFAGTMLGAIRHKGFIPWDDDVDVIVPRADYDKLKRIAEGNVFKEPYFFQSPSTDKGYPKGFCRLRNSDTTGLPYDDVAMKCNRGIFLDIFPLDVLPDDEKEKRKQIKKLRNTRLLMNSFARYYSGFGTMGTTRTKAVAYYLSLPLFKFGLLSMNKLFQKYERVASRYKDSNGKYAGSIAFSFENPRFIFERKWWESKVVLVDFEDIKVPVPENYDTLLKHSYGDYMTPVQEPTNHGTLLYSIDMPYDEFIKRHFDELKAGWYKQTEMGRKQTQ